MIRVIKKYKNRRLYDAVASRYITLEELQHYVLEGVLFRVVDASSEEDLTSSVLLQIIVEMEGGKSRWLSVDMLRQLIILANHPMNHVFKNMLQQVFSSLEKTMQSIPYHADYEKITESWQKNMQGMLKGWQQWFK